MHPHLHACYNYADDWMLVSLHARWSLEARMSEGGGRPPTHKSELRRTETLMMLCMYVLISHVGQAQPLPGTAMH